jgi:hypothetical protein
MRLQGTDKDVGIDQHSALQAIRVDIFPANRFIRKQRRSAVVTFSPGMELLNPFFWSQLILQGFRCGDMFFKLSIEYQLKPTFHT